MEVLVTKNDTKIIEKSQNSLAKAFNDRSTSVDSIQLAKTEPVEQNVLEQLFKKFGKWQLRSVFLIFLCKIPSAWFMSCILFTAPAPRYGEFYCKPPDSMANNISEWIDLSHPPKDQQLQAGKIFSRDFCNVFIDSHDRVNHFVHNKNKEFPWIYNNFTHKKVPCEKFEYLKDYESLITDFDLVCAREILVATTQFFHLIGVLVGGILATYLLNHISPRTLMLMGMLSLIVCGSLTGAVHRYEFHVLFRCLSAACCAQMFTAGGMIFTDITTGKYRTIVTTLHEQFWSIGVILLPTITYFFTSWTQIYFLISWSTFILIYLHRWIPDSPKWLLERGFVDDAYRTIKKFIEFDRIGNDKTIPVDLEQKLYEQSIRMEEKKIPSPGWFSLWRGSYAVRNMICIHLVWSCYVISYYGMLLNVKVFSRDHIHINAMVAGICELIGVFFGLFLIMTSKRKWLWIGMFNIIAGCIAFTAWMIPTTLKPQQRVAFFMLTSMISKIAISSAMAILTTCTGELVSADKKRLLGISTITFARVLALVTPYIGATAMFGQLVPQTSYATLAIIGGFLSILITPPVTQNANTNFCLAANLMRKA